MRALIGRSPALSIDCSLGSVLVCGNRWQLKVCNYISGARGLCHLWAARLPGGFTLVNAASVIRVALPRTRNQPRGVETDYRMWYSEGRAGARNSESKLMHTLSVCRSKGSSKASKGKGKQMNR